MPEALRDGCPFRGSFASDGGGEWTGRKNYRRNKKKLASGERESDRSFEAKNFVFV